MDRQYGTIYDVLYYTLYFTQYTNRLKLISVET